MGMIETLEHPHLAPHALLIPLDFPLQNGPQCGLARDVPRRRRLCGGTPRGRKGERGSRERVGGGGEGRHGWTGYAALSEGLVFWWYVSCPALLYAMTMMRRLCFYSECIHPRDHRTYHDFSKRASHEDVADVVLLFLVR